MLLIACTENVFTSHFLANVHFLSSQLAQPTASAGRELPATDRHADSQNVLLF